MHLETPVCDCACCGRKQTGSIFDKEDSAVVDLNDQEGQNLCEPLLMQLSSAEGRKYAENSYMYRHYWELFKESVTLKVNDPNYETYKTYLKVFNHVEKRLPSEKGNNEEEEEEEEVMVVEEQVLEPGGSANSAISRVEEQRPVIIKRSVMRKRKKEKQKEKVSTYALHPELVSNDYKFRICGSCRYHLNKGEIPQYSIRAGYDFGNLARIGLPNLSDLAKVVLGQCSGFGATIIKLKQLDMNKQITNDNMYNAITGHFIVFGPEVIPSPQLEKAVKDKNINQFKHRLANSINVSFLGTIPAWSFLRTRIQQKKLLTRMFNLSAKELAPWIHFLSFREELLNNLNTTGSERTYGTEHLLNLLILGTATNFFNNQDEMDDVVKMILEKCQVCTNPVIDFIDQKASADVTKLSAPLRGSTADERDRDEVDDQIERNAAEKAKHLSEKEKAFYLAKFAKRKEKETKDMIEEEQEEAEIEELAKEIDIANTQEQEELFQKMREELKSEDIVKTENEDEKMMKAEISDYITNRRGRSECYYSSGISDKSWSKGYAFSSFLISSLHCDEY